MPASSPTFCPIAFARYATANGGDAANGGDDDFGDDDFGDDGADIVFAMNWVHHHTPGSLFVSSVVFRLQNLCISLGVFSSSRALSVFWAEDKKRGVFPFLYLRPFGECVYYWADVSRSTMYMIHYFTLRCRQFPQL